MTFLCRLEVLSPSTTVWAVAGRLLRTRAPAVNVLTRAAGRNRHISGCEQSENPVPENTLSAAASSLLISSLCPALGAQLRNARSTQLLEGCMGHLPERTYVYMV